jgi:hypothetical protein
MGGAHQGREAGGAWVAPAREPASKAEGAHVAIPDPTVETGMLADGDPEAKAGNRFRAASAVLQFTADVAKRFGRWTKEATERLPASVSPDRARKAGKGLVALAPVTYGTYRGARAIQHRFAPPPPPTRRQRLMDTITELPPFHRQ